VLVLVLVLVTRYRRAAVWSRSMRDAAVPPDDGPARWNARAGADIRAE
jgi:hypothetical protein